MIKKIYEAPTVEVINLTTKGYICEGEDVFFGGSGHVQNLTGNIGGAEGDEAKRGHFDLDLANYEPWEDWKEY